MENVFLVCAEVAGAFVALSPEDGVSVLDVHATNEEIIKLMATAFETALTFIRALPFL
ncbi:hypothetical protein D3C85_1817950 [compost metagenome]